MHSQSPNALVQGRYVKTQLLCPMFVSQRRSFTNPVPEPLRFSSHSVYLILLLKKTPFLFPVQPVGLPAGTPQLPFGLPRGRAVEANARRVGLLAGLLVGPAADPPAQLAKVPG